MGWDAGQGFVCIYSEPGKGTTFKMFSPLAQRILEKLGYVVLTSASPGEALDVACEHAGDIIHLP